MNDWNIQSRAHTCDACHQAFVDQQTYHTVLSDQRREFLRQDLCVPCWERQAIGAAAQAGFVSHWQGVYQAPPPVAEPIQKETAETLLRKLIERNEPQYLPAGFILAVMLERKRVLKVKEQIVRDGRRTIIYEQPKSGEVLTITDPDLHLNQLEEVQRLVAHLLEHGLNPTPTEEAATPGTEITNSQTPIAASPVQAEADPVTVSGTTPQ